MITLEDYFMGRDEKFRSELKPEYVGSAKDLLARVNLLLAKFRQMTGDTEFRHVTSGWRPALINAATPGAAKKSKHMTCQAIDIQDDDGNLDEWCLEHQGLLADCGLWLEHPAATKGWCHLQSIAPRSGNRVFYP